jgi:transposase
MLTGPAAQCFAQMTFSATTTIGGIGDTTAAMIIAELGDPARFESAGALAAYVGVCPAHKHSGKHQPKSSSLSPIGNRRLRRGLWMPTLSAATQSNRWLMVFYRRPIERGKPHKVALCAAMRKLLAAIYSVAKHRRPFSTNLNPQSELRVRYENA